MLQTLRNNMKLVLWITVIFFVLLIFLVWGADLQFGGQGQAQTGGVVGTVNGEPILAATYQQVLAYNRQNVQAQGRELEPTEELRIEEETWNLLVNELLLAQEAKKRGLEARDAEVRATVLNTPPPIITQDPNFQNAQGQFDAAKYQAVIRDPATPEAFLIQLEAYVRDYLPTQKLQSLVLTSAKTTDEELRRAYLEDNEKADVVYVLLEAGPAGVDPTVAEADLETYFREHGDEYRLPRRATLTYVMVPRRPTAQDSLQIRRDLAEMAGEAREAERTAQAGTENLGVSDFATLAASFSETPHAEDGGLSPGYVRPEEMSPALAAAVGTLAPGQISEPFQDGLFYHIVQVADMKEENGQRVYQLRDLGVRIAPSDSTLQAEQERLEALRQRATASDLETAAREAGLSTRRAADVVASGFVPGLASIPEIGAWAHEQRPGTVSRVFGASNGWYLVQVDEFAPEGVPSLESVKDRVRGDLLSKRRLEATRARAESLAARVRGGATLEAAAAADTLVATPAPGVSRTSGIAGLGREAGPMAAVFTLPVGRTSEPIETPRGWVLLRVDQRAPVDWAQFEFQKDQLRRARQSTKEAQLMDRFLENLRDQAKIIDYRS